jgi:hypothetical protein
MDCGDVINVVQMVDFFISPQYIFGVQVYAAGDDVFERLAQRTQYLNPSHQSIFLIFERPLLVMVVKKIS